MRPLTYCATCGESVKRCRLGCSCLMWDSPSTSPLWMKAMTALGWERPMNLAGAKAECAVGTAESKGLRALHSLSHVVDAVLWADKYEEVVMRHAKYGQATQLGLHHT